MIKIKELPEETRKEFDGTEDLIIQPLFGDTRRMKVQTFMDKLKERTIVEVNEYVDNRDVSKLIEKDWRLERDNIIEFITNGCEIPKNSSNEPVLKTTPGNLYKDKRILPKIDFIKKVAIDEAGPDYIYVDSEQIGGYPCIKGQIVCCDEVLYYYKRDFANLPEYYYPDTTNFTWENFDTTKVKDIYGLDDGFDLRPSEATKGLPDYAAFFILSDHYNARKLDENDETSSGGNVINDVIVHRVERRIEGEWRYSWNFVKRYEYYWYGGNGYPESSYVWFLTDYIPPLNDLNFWQQINIKFDENSIITSQNGQCYLRVQNWEVNNKYIKGNLIVHDNILYLCVEDHVSSDWDIDNNNGYWNSSGGGEGGVMNFTKGKPYKEGSLVVYNNNLYQRITSGRDTEWVPENWYLLTNANISSLFVKYSHTIPQSDEDIQDEPAEYIGISYGNYATAPTHYNNYQWYKIKGEDGTINLEANSLVLKYTLEADNWVHEELEGYYYQRITRNSFSENSNNRKIMNLVTSTTRPIADVELSEPEEGEDIDIELWNNEIANYSKITAIITDNNSEGGGQITFYCLSKPEADFTIKLRIHGDIHEDRFVTTTTFQTYQTTIENQRTNLQNQINDLQTLIGSLNTTLEDILEGGD